MLTALLATRIYLALSLWADNRTDRDESRRTEAQDESVQHIFDTLLSAAAAVAGRSLRMYYFVPCMHACLHAHFTLPAARLLPCIAGAIYSKHTQTTTHDGLGLGLRERERDYITQISIYTLPRITGNFARITRARPTIARLCGGAAKWPSSKHPNRLTDRFRFVVSAFDIIAACLSAYIFDCRAHHQRH